MPCDLYSQKSHTRTNKLILTTNKCKNMQTTHGFFMRLKRNLSNYLLSTVHSNYGHWQAMKPRIWTDDF